MTRYTPLLLILLCVGCDLAPVATPSPMVIPSLTPIYQEGTGGDGTTTENTAPFVLPAGVYRVQYAAIPLTGDSCFFGGFLLSADPAQHQIFDLGPITTTQPLTGALTTPPLPAAPYYVRVIATCYWAVQVAPQP